MSYIPQTPERPSSRTTRQFTTSTPISNSHTLLTPCTATKKPLIQKANITTTPLPKHNHHIPATPEVTPQNNSTTRRKKINDLLFETDSEVGGKERLSFGLLLPVPSTVGSGRKKRSSGGVSVSANSGNVLFDHCEQFEEEEEVVENVLGTPKSQVITSKMVDNWHGKSFNNAFSDEEDDDVQTMTFGESKLIPRVKLDNPFIGETTTSTLKKEDNPFLEPGSKVDYETHMELVNHRTGDKRIIKLTKNQMKIQPKKLSFI
ncbi:hypothetical protein JA1_004203 [Spathaspora sp. JA1]|nr:hypothetical protein JA1_004203 [Spathaspora sp. JA1]